MTDTNLHKVAASLILLSSIAISACDPDEPIDGEAMIDEFVVTDETHEDPIDEVAAPPVLLAWIERGTASVEWRAAGNGGTEVFLLIRGTDADAPIIDMDTAETLSPVEAWVALADEPELVPPLLLERATVAERELLADPVRIAEVRARVAEQFALALDVSANLPEPHAYGTCTAGQISTARTVYGNGYTPSATCGDHLGFQTTYADFLYCGDGPSDGCDHPLARNETMCIPAVTDAAVVYGELKTVSMRSKTSGNPTFQTNGHRIRSLTYNCHNDNALDIHMAYGTDEWDYNGLESGYYIGVVILGSAHLPASVTAIDVVAYNAWDNGKGESGTTYKATEYSVTGNAAAGDFGIFCTGAQKSITMSPGPTGNGHWWCVGSCSVGNCWD
ncbi:hypothetical protein [Enhygromyxa salina]|uniref:Uncharacterized protein n=1 Tax=Enhygromyxa salina TaxID=215803 RepID=A0A2S9XQP8_9BACT|nr:hypothetical protein [Enhygromyxa salina]PRP95187.1 hypothetical protein ENSA7_75010 [Enhygromyxa salina]